MPLKPLAGHRNRGPEKIRGMNKKCLEESGSLTI